MKPGLLSGPRSRPTADGGRINVVAFRHGVPGTFSSNHPMPVNIYNLMLKETQRAESIRGIEIRWCSRCTPKGRGWRSHDQDFRRSLGRIHTKLEFTKVCNELTRVQVELNLRNILRFGL